MLQPLNSGSSSSSIGQSGKKDRLCSLPCSSSWNGRVHVLPRSSSWWNGSIQLTCRRKLVYENRPKDSCETPLTFELGANPSLARRASGSNGKIPRYQHVQPCLLSLEGLLFRISVWCQGQASRRENRRLWHSTRAIHAAKSDVLIKKEPSAFVKPTNQFLKKSNLR